MMIELKLNIPDKNDFIRWYKIIHFHLTGGFSCTKCGAKSDYDHVQFTTKLQGTNFIFENSTDGICACCTQQELNDHAKMVYNITTTKCEWCKEVKPTATFIRHEELESSITFGNNYWNGQNICQDCMNSGINTGKDQLHSSRQAFDKNGKLCYTNSLGIKIKE